MQTLQIDKKNAVKLFPTASKEFKQMLIDTFGEQFFSQKITDRVKSFEDACFVTGEDPNFYGGTSDEIAYKKIKIIVRALNEGWVPDWDNSREYKYYPWFYMNAENGFCLYYVLYRFTCSNVGSRLCFKSEELAKYAATQFKDLYKAFFTL